MSNQILASYIVGAAQVIFFIASLVFSAVRKRWDKLRMEKYFAEAALEQSQLESRIKSLEEEMAKSDKEFSPRSAFQFLRAAVSENTTIIRRLCKKCEVSPNLFQEDFPSKESHDD